jgi:hypothetical protein
MGNWKGVQTDKTVALYDLRKDIGEENDVAAKNPKVAKRIKAIIDELE